LSGTLFLAPFYRPFRVLSHSWARIPVQTEKWGRITASFVRLPPPPTGRAGWLAGWLMGWLGFSVF